MELTGKCKEDFQQWHLDTQKNKSIHSLLFSDLKDYPDNMQFGIYQDFFDSVSITIGRGANKLYFTHPENNVSSWYKTQGYYDLNRAEAIKKANEIYNQSKE